MWSAVAAAEGDLLLPGWSVGDQRRCVTDSDAAGETGAEGKMDSNTANFYHTCLTPHSLSVAAST